MNRIITALLLAVTGCYYGSMTGARTLGEKHMTVTASVGLPAYLSADDRREAGESSTDDVPVSPSVTFLSGVTDRIDIGAYARAWGIGPLIRVGLLSPDLPYSVSINAGAGYIVPAKLLSTRFGLTAGYSVGESLEIYGGCSGGYSPDVINIPEDGDGNRNWNEVENKYHYGFNAGVRYTLPPPEEDQLWIPEAVGFEFAIPMDLSRDIVLFGLAVTY
ncbi:hypothetical protein CSA37_04260 [Candidatus Fermentibacteria bacterium]|nr:MAG: hypothetical protein CSA37_04260 [Candidatus Fermentibacteria bacterium]